MDSKLSTHVLEAALNGLEAQRRNLDEQIAEIRSVLAGSIGGQAGKRKDHANQAQVATQTKSERTLSPEARARIARAQRLRWAKAKKAAKKAA